ncbi:MAG: hypothetical protein IJJ70_04145 [Treponema sp.]|nr:hypothetical protein [Treponema sp.]MBR0486883.1 hypothetical protein [Treponema sp.]
MKASKFILLAFPAFLQTGLFAQTKTSSKTSVTMPSAPTMPSISAPALGNGFYVPGSDGFYSGHKNVPAGTNSKTVASTETAAANPAATAKNTDSTDALSLLTNSAGTISSMLTAGDLSSLDSMGVLPSVGGLLNSTNKNASDTVMLRQILNELNELKQQVNAVSTARGTTPATTTAVTDTKQTERSKLLRFVINGTDILGSLRSIYFSHPESDGTFLLTADRVYLNSSKTNTETFHLLFRAAGTKNSGTVFTVSPAVTQSADDTDSPVYRLAQINNLKAGRTGNLVTLRTEQDGLKVDVLIALE